MIETYLEWAYNQKEEIYSGLRQRTFPKTRVKLQPGQGVHLASSFINRLLLLFERIS